MTARAIFRAPPRPRRAALGLAVMVALGCLWLAAASRVHVNTSWSDGAWGYLAWPLAGAPEIGDAVLFRPPDAVGAEVAYLKTVRGVSGMRVVVDEKRWVTVGGVRLGRAKTRALDGRALEVIAPGEIPAGRYYLHGPHPDSHDSRYAEIGLVAAERIEALAVALPDLPWLGLEGPLVGPETGPVEDGPGTSGAAP